MRIPSYSNPGNLSRAVKELGGTGRIHDWTLSRRIRDSGFSRWWRHPGNVARRSPPFDLSASICAAVSARTTTSTPPSFDAFLAAIPNEKV
jgi:hypothetical protein